ncbi:aryl-alcohol-oxidase from pleurotus Eryingii [Rickenella mellea]|uniref:Aryl-alcohol-oxidase from pleurotus Eryingii n=1 Tax=Rickenella mellea TaxID=50990 RepID=A0A4Y7PKH1_9AGAM|nr:aryl-alcohol-oxidase from pleurotus Eryingii [Rickenella mellea]
MALAFSSVFRVLVASALVSSAFAALYDSPSQLPQTVFDYVIIGGGTAGAVVANRLTEDRDVSVLVLEAGRSNKNILEIEIPFYGPGVSTPPDLFWNYTIVPQPGYNNRSFFYERGRVLGGSSSVNGDFYTRGSSDDYDGYARLTGDNGWSWNSLKKYIPRHEKFVPPADDHNTTGEFVPSAHGKNGLVQVSLPGFAFPSDEHVIATTKELPQEFPFNQDHNDGTLLGVAWSQGTVGHPAKRSSSATAYLADEFLNRPNMHVLVHAQATKIIQTGTVKGRPSFHAVQFGDGLNLTGPFHAVNATKEIIVSCGPIGTPHLLQLSGIGDAKALAQVGIKSVINNPHVGQNMTDHSLAVAPYTVPDGQSLDHFLRGDNLTASVAEWNATMKGPLTFAVSNHLGFHRLPNNSSILAGGDPSAGPGASHIELVLSPTWVQFPDPRPPTGSFFTISVAVSCPTSRGTITLASADPFAQPNIDPNYMATDFDIKTHIEGVKMAQRFVAAKAWDGFILEPFGAYANATTDEKIEEYLRSTALTFSHILGGAEVSAKGASWGVVDPDLKVKGAEGLRVVDASIFPYLPSAHPMAATYLFAERASDLIKADRRK